MSNFLVNRLAAKLLQELCKEATCREMVQCHDGVPVLISQLHCDNVNLLLPLMWCLVQICEDPNASKEVRQMGGIPLILSFITVSMHCMQGNFAPILFSPFSPSDLNLKLG